MNKHELNDYRREYNKTEYKTVKVYIPIKEYPQIKDHVTSRGYQSISGYIKKLIDADINTGK